MRPQCSAMFKGPVPLTNMIHKTKM